MYKKMFLFLLLSLEVLFAQNIKEVLIASENWEYYTNKDGSGLYFDIVRMIYEPIDIKVKVKIYPYKRSSMMVKKKLVDAWLGSYMDEENYAIYPKQYFDRDILIVMFKKEKYPNFVDIKSLENQDVCWIRGYGLDEYIDVKVNKHERNDRKSILLGLSKDRFGFFLDDKYDMQDAIEKNNFDASSYNFVEVAQIPLYPGFRNDDRGKKLKEIWDERYKKIIEDGSLKQLYIKHNLPEDYLFEELR